MKNLGSVGQRNRFDGSLLYAGDEFERKTGRSKYLMAIYDTKYVWFLDKKKNRIKSEFSQKRHCPLCATVKHRLIFIKNGFRHVKCDKCGFVFVSPILADRAAERFYKKENAWVKVMLSKEERRVNRIMYRYALKFLRAENLSRNTNILDIGCGSGLFMEAARGTGWKVTGVELNKRMLVLARKKKLKVYRDLAGLKKSGDRFAVITLWFVLEHIKDPRRLLKDIAGLLLKDGLLLIGVPNLDALVNRLYGEESQTFAGHSHINFFNRDFLDGLVSEYGFTLIATETQITQLNNIKKFLTHMGVSQNSGVKRILRDLTPKYLHTHMLGSNLIAVFKKTS